MRFLHPGLSWFPPRTIGHWHDLTVPHSPAGFEHEVALLGRLKRHRRGSPCAFAIVAWGTQMQVLV
jgi:hypothetical protein